MFAEWRDVVLTLEVAIRDSPEIRGKNRHQIKTNTALDRRDCWCEA
jgi:hypothetical protein